MREGTERTGRQIRRAEEKKKSDSTTRKGGEEGYRRRRTGDGREKWDLRDGRKDGERLT